MKSFRFRERVKMAGEGVLDIPHMAMLRDQTPEELKESFERTWGCSLAGVVLPVIAPDGLLFKTDDVDIPMSSYAKDNGKIVDISNAIAKFSSLGINIYLMLDPTVHICRTDTLHIVDIVGDGSASICIGNTASQELLGYILGTAIIEAHKATSETTGKLVGVVMDTVDLWPMGASDDRIEMTCFCPSCVSYFEGKVDLSHFRTFPNPWNLLLKDAGSGIEQTGEIRPNSTPANIVGFSRQKGFSDIYGTVENADLIEMASLLHQYVRCRHNQTVTSISNIFKEAFPEDEFFRNVKRILLTEGAYYSWTAGLVLESLDENTSSFDEVWFDPRSADIFLKEMPFRSYMWRRSRYYIDSFLTFAGNVGDKVARTTTGIARLSNAEAKDKLKTRLNQALHTALTEKSALASLPALRQASEKGSQRIGFVGVALDEDVGTKFINGLKIAPGLNDGTGRRPVSEEELGGADGVRQFLEMFGKRKG